MKVFMVKFEKLKVFPGLLHRFQGHNTPIQRASVITYLSRIYPYVCLIRFLKHAFFMCSTGALFTLIKNFTLLFYYSRILYIEMTNRFYRILKWLLIATCYIKNHFDSVCAKDHHVLSKSIYIKKKTVVCIFASH